jgi:hypothetical protein
MPPVIFNEVIPGVHYGCHPDHRSGNQNKSQWIISTSEEVESFRLSYSQGWVVGTRAWGLHLINDRPAYLGIAIDRSRQLFVARFEDGSGNLRWHGYPADHQKKVNDRLPEKLKELWIRNNVLPAPKVRKLVTGAPCSL